VLRRNGAVVAESSGLALAHVVDAERFADGERSAAYRVEVTVERAADGVALPWIVGNAILVDGADAPASRLPPLAAGAAARFSLFDAAGKALPWRVEKDEASALDVAETSEPRRLALEFTLGPAGRERWVALAWSLPSRLEPSSVVVMKAAASEPSRVWVQLRSSAGPGDLRWRRSVYLDADGEEQVIPLHAFVPVGAAAAAAARHLADVLLVVVDTTHRGPGRPGTVWLERLDVQ
jgi:hypothetical protein